MSNCWVVYILKTAEPIGCNFLWYLTWTQKFYDRAKLKKMLPENFGFYINSTYENRKTYEISSAEMIIWKRDPESTKKNATLQNETEIKRYFTNNFFGCSDFLVWLFFFTFPKINLKDKIFINLTIILVSAKGEH